MTQATFAEIRTLFIFRELLLYANYSFMEEQDPFLIVKRFLFIYLLAIDQESYSLLIVKWKTV